MKKKGSRKNAEVPSGRGKKGKMGSEKKVKIDAEMKIKTGA